MIISILSITIFVVTGLYMLVRSRFMATKRVALLAFAAAGVEWLLFGLISEGLNPTATMLAIAARIAIFVCCVMAMRCDKEQAKARVRRRHRFAADMHNVMVPLRIVRRQNNAAQVREVA
ncbi:MAG: hypothetical protein IJU16_02850 [Clostridia bacterium]|nr:hypothetical protein [Clostridia bacterium]